MSHPLASVLAQLRTIFAREELPPPQAEAPPSGREGGGILRLLFGVEALPSEAPLSRTERRGLLPLLFAPEPLPREPELSPGRARTSWLRMLFLPERIGRDPDPPEVN